MRLVFHIGIHKTGSTLIQKNLSKNLGVLREKGIFYVNEEIPDLIIKQREYVRKLQVPSRNDPSKDSLMQANARLLEAAQRANANIVLISEENRIGFPLYLEVTKVGAPARFYPRADECLNGVLNGLQDLETKLILYRRRFERLIPSLYSEALRNLATTETIDGFCRQIDFASLDYGKLLGRVTKGAPDAELIVKPFEWIKKGAEAFLEDFVQTAGLGTDGFSFSTKFVREGVDQRKGDALRELAMLRNAEGMSKAIAIRKKEILAHPNDEDSSIMLPDWVAEKLPKK